MTLPVNRRVVGLLINLFTFLQTISGQYQIPDVTISALKPRGFRASIPDAPNVSLFVFQGNVNRPIGSTDVGTISGEVLQPKDGWWTVEEPGIELKIGDVINYYVVVTADRAGYIKDKLSYTVTALEDRTLTPNTPPPPPPLRPTPSPPECRPTATLVQGGTACAGQTIFEENFDNFRDDIWQIEQYLPSSPVRYLYRQFTHFYLFKSLSCMFFP
uniref:SFRICE_012689 n=1 Tax=Spodoptera frugiperda TaxID=7108 RepID=A0A2H1WU49_SPOFR